MFDFFVEASIPLNYYHNLIYYQVNLIISILGSQRSQNKLKKLLSISNLFLINLNSIFARLLFLLVLLVQQLLSPPSLLLRKSYRLRVLGKSRKPSRKVNQFIVSGCFLLNQQMVTTTWWCICLIMIAVLLPDISHGLTQCLTPFAAYEFSFMTHIHPRGRGTMKAPLQNP